MGRASRFVAGLLFLPVAIALLSELSTGSRASVADASEQLLIQGGSPVERRCATEAFVTAVKLYESLGIHLPAEPPCTLRFREVVAVAGQEMRDVLGCYDRSSHTITMLPFDAPALEEGTVCCLENRASAYRMVLVHEFAHYLNSLVAPGLDPVIDECIAGYMQFEAFGLTHKEAILENVEPIRSLHALTIIAYTIDPRSFLIAGHEYFRDHPWTLQMCLSGKAPPIKDPFVMEP